MAETGVAHKVISVILRLSELASAIIVLGILSRFTYLAGIAQVHIDGRIIYAIVVACLGIIYSICFCPPFKPLFLGFPFDFVMFVMWLVAYCLLQTVGPCHPLITPRLLIRIHREPGATLALRVGTTIIGATTGVAIGESDLLGR